MVNEIQWSGQEATNSAYCFKDSLLAKYPIGLEYFNMEQVLVLHKGDLELEFSTWCWFWTPWVHRSPLYNIWTRSEHFWLRYGTQKVFEKIFLTYFKNIFATTLGLFCTFAEKKVEISPPPKCGNSCHNFLFAEIFPLVPSVTDFQDESPLVLHPLVHPSY